MKNLILATVARNLIPFVLVYAAYVTTGGHLAPGGGFAGGTLAAAAIILGVLAWGLDRKASCHCEGWLCSFESTALWAYVGIGFVGALAGRPFLTNLASGWPSGSVGDLLSAGMVWALGAAVAVKVAATLVGLYDRISEEKQDTPHG